MKLRKLEIENIASFEHEVIDFAGSPLEGTDLFLINGETGSGKSTILDAICLALYGDTPRLHNSESQAEKRDMPEGVSYNDARRLLRLNTGRGFVRLTFDAEGEEWQAEWGVRRARDKASGALQAKSWTLTNLSTKVNITRDDEIKQTIVKLIGLDFTQFCRTTMLSQGEFAAFLKSKPDEKAQILKKITGVDRFEKIGAIIYTITSEKKAILAEIESQKKALETEALTPERRLELEEENREHERNKKLAEETRSRLQAARKWVDDESAIGKRLTLAQADLQRAELAQNDKNVVRASETVAVHDQTGDVRMQFEALRKSEKDETAARTELNQQQAGFSELSAALNRLRNDVIVNGKRLAGIQQAIDANASLKDIFESAAVLAGECKNLAGWQRDIADKQAQLKAKEAEIQDVISPRINKISAEIEEISGRHQELTSRLEVKEKELEACDLEGKRQQKDSALAEQGRLAELSTAIGQLEKCSGEISKLQSDIIATDDIVSSTTGLLTTDNQNVIAANSARDTQQQAADSAQMAAGKSAKEIRARLRIGSICPVCGHEIMHELKSDKLLRDLADQAKAKLNELNRSYEEALKFQTEHRNTLSLKQKELMKYRSELERREAEKSEIEKKIADVCGVLNIIPEAELDLNVLKGIHGTRADELKIRLSDIEKGIAEGEAIDRALRELRKSIAGNQTALDSTNSRTSAEEKKKADADAAVSALTAAIATLQGSIDAAISRLEATIGDKKVSGHDFRSEPVAFAGDLRKAADAYQRLLDDSTRLTHELDSLTEIIRSCDDKRASILADIPEWEESEDQEQDGPVTQDLNRPVSQDSPKIDPRKTEQAFDSLRSQVIAANVKLRKALEDSRAQRADIREFFLNHPELDREQVETISRLSDRDIAGLRAKVQNAINRVEQCRTSLDSVRAEHEAVLSLKPEWLVMEGEVQPDTAESSTDDDAFEGSETPDAPERIPVAELSDRISQTEGIITESATQMALIQKAFADSAKHSERLAAITREFDAAAEDYSRWNNLNSLLGDAQGKRFSNIALSHLLGNLIHHANTYMVQLNDRYTLDVIPGTFSIMVCDRYQGYSQRTANTISGGETFLVSLALALALSNIGQLSGCDTLFIDEGFGSLSGGPLDKAIDTLKNLHRQDGRRIGIISHITELREKIPTQILVERTPTTPATIHLLPTP